MADNNSSVSEVGFWLPSEFLTDEDIIMDNEIFNEKGLSNSNNKLCFPTEYPYGFGLVDSVNEMESDEDEFLTGLTRQFARSTLRETYKPPYAPYGNPEKTLVLSGSPQSTLSPVFSNGSPNASSPKTPFGGNDDAWDLLCAAAGQVNLMKMKNDGPIKTRGLIGPTRSFNSVDPTSGLYTTHLRQVKQENASIWDHPEVYQTKNSSVCVGNSGEYVGNGRCGRALGLPESAWPSLQVQKQHYYGNGGRAGMRPVFLGGGSGGDGDGAGRGVKRECAGTGVFLPRRYLAPCARNNSGSSSNLPPRVIQSLNKNFDNMTTHAQNQAQAHFNGCFTQYYDLLMARRNALLAQQRRNNMWAGGAMKYEISLPQEWTY